LQLRSPPNLSPQRGRRHRPFGLSSGGCGDLCQMVRPLLLAPCRHGVKPLPQRSSSP